MTLFILFFLLVLCFGLVLIVGAPYLPTQKKQAGTALELLNLKQGQILYELGCGDGRMLLRAAQKGIGSVGYELNPILVIVARIATWKYRKTVHIVWGNFWNADLSKADGVFVFLLERYMQRLDTKLQAEASPRLPVVSYAFKIPGQKITKQKNGLFLYYY